MAQASARAPSITRSTHFCTSSDNKRVCYERSSVVMPTSFSHDIAVLCAHGNGYCKEMFNPVIDDVVAHLSKGAHGREKAAARMRETKIVFASLDFRNHGDSSMHPFDRSDKSIFDLGFAPMFDGAKNDVLAVIEDLERTMSLGTDVKLVGLAHSMGGAVTVLAALERPDAFTSLTLYEPTLPPPPPKHSAGKEFKPPGLLKVARGTVRRKSRFASRQEAFSYFRGGKMCRTWSDRAVEAYVNGGLRELPSGEVELKCHPVLEVSMFMTNPTGYVDLERSGGLTMPVHLLCGTKSTVFASTKITQSIFKKTASALGNARVTLIDGADHYLPMTNPTTLAEHFASDLSRLGVSPSKL